MLDRVIKQLKFFKRFDEETREKIYKNAELISLPGHTVIFNQGDIGDKLYVILKGRVAVQINSKEFGSLPVVIATLSDGDHFGELSLISLSRVQDNSNKQQEVLSLNKDPTEFLRRKATCLVTYYESFQSPYIDYRAL
jgi:CRP-like cAMP-binding protein